MSDIKIIALGGVRENAKNLYIVEINLPQTRVCLK